VARPVRAEWVALVGGLDRLRMCGGPAKAKRQLLAAVMSSGGIDMAQRATERIAAGVTPRSRGGATGARGVAAHLWRLVCGP
jgi:hypothetical protein